MSHPPELTLDGRVIGTGHPPYIVAELSANHNGSLDRALATLQAAKDAGAHAVKLQTYTPDTMTIDSDQEWFKIRGGLWDGNSLYELYQQAHTPFEWQKTLFARARALGITVFSTPFDESAIDLLQSLQAPAYKIASFELLDLPLIARVARCGKPMIMSTGMASLHEIDEAVATARAHGCESLALLHCVSGYPTPLQQANVASVAALAQRYKVVVGLSDHTRGHVAANASIALGGSMVEKHFILDRNLGGPDAAFSIEPDELSQLVTETAATWTSLGRADFSRADAERDNVRYRRSLFFVEAVTAGTVLTEHHIRRIRPGQGLHPRHYHDVLGLVVRQDVPRGTPVSWELLEKPSV